MLAPTSWLAELVGLDAVPPGEQVAADLVRVGLEEEALHGGSVTGPLVVGRVLDKTDEPQKNGKTVHFCHVDIGREQPQEIVCGAHNFAAGDLVAVILPGGRLGDIEIAARKTYGHVSAGMIVSERELGIGEDHAGIIVLTDYFAGDEATLSALTPGQDAMPLFGLGEQVVEVNVTPDRGYCFSMRGIAREYALAIGRGEQFRDPVGPDQVQPPATTEDGYEVRLYDAARIHGVAGCDRYVARIVRGIDPTAASPGWMKQRLAQLGMRPISLAVDITNYLMLLTGQPLHAFDLDTLSGAIEVRRAQPGERLVTLDDVDRDLDPEDLLITDGGTTPLALAGVMGGATSEVTPATRNVLIEAAHFDAVTVARTSRRHRLSSEASRRFERGVDPAICAAVAELAVRMLVEYAGGTADPAVTDMDRREPGQDITFDTGSAWRLIQPGSPGTDPVPAGLSHADVVACLRSLGCQVTELATVTEGSFGFVRVTPPSWRPDLRNGPDLVEEVARLRGYDAIPAVLPMAPGGRGLTASQRGIRVASAALAGLGLIEVWSYPFVGAGVGDQLGYDAGDARRYAVRLANPLSDEAPHLRTSLLATLLPTLRMNVRRGSKDVALYEQGVVFTPGGPLRQAPVPAVGVRPDEHTLRAILDAVPAQPRHVAIALAGDAAPAGPWGPGRAWSAADAIGLAVALGRAFAQDLSVRAGDASPFHPGRCAQLALPDGTVLGHAGELHPKVVAALELPARTCAAELNLDALIAASGDPAQPRALSTYPVAHSDVALEVAEAVPAAEVADALRRGAGPDLEALALFDVYRGDQLAEGTKSLAYRLSFRASDRTLTTDEVSAARDAAIACATQQTGAVQRG